MSKDLRDIVGHGMREYPASDMDAAVLNMTRREWALIDIKQIEINARAALAESICEHVYEALPNDAVVSGYIASDPDGEPSVTSLMQRIVHDESGRRICIPRYTPGVKPKIAFDRVEADYKCKLRKNALDVLELDPTQTEEIPAQDITHVLVPSPIYWGNGIVAPRNTGYFHVHRDFRQVRDSTQFWGLAFLQAKLDKTSMHEPMDAVFAPSGKDPLIRGFDTQ